ncbi:hypothetical protein Q427_04625 [Halomonas sp. BC04]|nr:hypothetical protein Q427_04625 [Halomonas sp. BC04]
MPARFTGTSSKPCSGRIQDIEKIDAGVVECSKQAL